MSKTLKEDTFGDYQFEKWIPYEVRKQIKEFWGCFGRTHKEWLKNAETNKCGLPSYGEHVIVLKEEIILGHTLYKKNEGRFIFAWNNMGRLIDDEGNIFYVSSCDKFLIRR